MIKAILLVLLVSQSVLAANEEGCQPIGDTCLLPEDIQQCFDHLGDLSADDESVDNTCEAVTRQVSSGFDFYIESRKLEGGRQPGDGQTFANNLKNAFENAPQPNGYCTVTDPSFPANNSGLCGAGGNITWKWNIEFSDAEASQYEFEFGVDFGNGGALFVDGVFHWANPGDMWWGGNDWNHPHVIRTSLNLGAGPHQIQLYGHEGCCDGAFNGRFKRNGGSWLAINSTNMSQEIPVNDDDIMTYDFLVNYVAPYQFHEGCLRQQITFQGHIFNEGTAQFNEWQFNSQTQEITFSVKHADLEPFGCLKQTNDEEYMWQCEMGLHIFFAGEEQYTYTFFMKSYLSRVYTDQLTVSVEPNLVEGDCCENELNIQTTLQFCTDMSCNVYLSNPLTVNRKDDIFVEHSIVSAEFQYYYLHGLQIKIGPFVPTIINQDASQPARVIYQVRSNIAMNNMVIEAISRIDENPQRRQLEEVQMREDYKVKASGNIDIIEGESSAQDADDDQNESDDTNQIIIIACATAGSLLAIAGFSFGIFMILRKKPSTPQTKYQDNTSEGNLQTNSNSHSRRDSNVVLIKA